MSARAKSRTMYMHTINRRPATYEPGGQIEFASDGRYARKGITLVPSIAQIREEQRASDQWRQSKNFDTGLFKYGYVRVEVPQ